MSDTPQPPAAVAALRLPKAYPLHDLAIAPENLRAAEPPDEEIPQLAATIRAAGLLQPLTVRPGRRREKPAMVLDGRRRLLALQALCAAGEIAPDYPVAAFEETDPRRQAAGVVLTNTAAPVHIADVIAAIGRMLAARLAPAAIAGALGYAEQEVRRLAALSALHPTALAALKAGRLTLRQAKLLARLADRDAQGELAQAVLEGYGFQEWRITERLDAGRVTAVDARFSIVGPERYAAAGGRTEGDLFGERADVLLDPEILHMVWAERAEAIAQGLAAEGRVVRVTPGPGDVDEALEAFGGAWGLGLDAEGQAAWRAAQSAARAAEAALEPLDLTLAQSDAALAGFLGARLAELCAGEPPRPVTLVEVFASHRSGLDLAAYGPARDPEPPEPDPGAAPGRPSDGEGDAPSARLTAPAAPRPVAAAAAAELEGVGHALHETRTDVATRALIRALAEDPSAALTTLVARLFDVLVRRSGVARGDGALSVGAEAYGRPGRAATPELDGEVRRRLGERRAAWADSGLTPIAWVAGLEDEARLALLAELVALSLDLREARTTELRAAARAEAAEIAALCGAEVAGWWTPDAAFLSAHSKPQLIGMLEAMGAAEAGAAGRRKDELVALVAAEAAARRWAPSCLSWTVVRAAREGAASPDA